MHPKRVEKKLIRFMVLCAVILSVFQMTTLTDPVDFYLKMAGDIDAPAFKYDTYVNSKETVGEIQPKKIALFFSISPVAEVIVKQNEKTIGIIKDQTRLEVEQGTVILDARAVPYPIVVDILLNEKKYRIELNREMKSFNVLLRENATS